MELGVILSIECSPESTLHGVVLQQRCLYVSQRRNMLTERRRSQERNTAINQPCLLSSPCSKRTLILRVTTRTLLMDKACSAPKDRFPPGLLKPPRPSGIVHAITRDSFSDNILLILLEPDYKPQDDAR